MLVEKLEAEEDATLPKRQVLEKLAKKLLVKQVAY
jgi:hypothetical protein